MPEVTLKDSFGKAIDRTLRDYRFQSCLELGSFDGDGSTQVIIQALADARNPRLVCIEADPDRFKNLVANTARFPWVVFKAYKNSRVHAELLADPQWNLVWEDRLVRHGASIFVRAGLQPSLPARIRNMFAKK